MNIRKVPIVAFLLLLVAPDPADAGLFGAAPSRYSAEPIEGRVLDRETGRPISGAVVVAQWVLAKPLEGHETDHWIVIEATTDGEGRYHVPGWGPERRPWLRWLTYYDPELVIFKSGYWPLALPNEDPTTAPLNDGINHRGAEVRKAYWDGRDILLLPFRFGQETERRQLEYPGGDHLRPEEGREPVLMTEERWVDQIAAAQAAVGWEDDRSWSTVTEWLRIRNFARAVNQECLGVSANLRYKVSSIPVGYAEDLLGGAPLCR